MMQNLMHISHDLKDCRGYPESQGLSIVWMRQEDVQVSYIKQVVHGNLCAFSHQIHKLLYKNIQNLIQPAKTNQLYLYNLGDMLQQEQSQKY